MNKEIEQLRKEIDQKFKIVFSRIATLEGRTTKAWNKIHELEGMIKLSKAMMRKKR